MFPRVTGECYRASVLAFGELVMMLIIGIIRQDIVTSLINSKETITEEGNGA